MFNFTLMYNDIADTAKKLYNGNISQTSWNTLSNNTTGNPVSTEYVYTYDHLNRITSAIGTNTSNYNLDLVQYDKNGNIITLNRKGHTNTGATSFGNMDLLNYEYKTNSNKLKKVTDTSGKIQGFNDGSNQATDYYYDANGNMKEDINKGIIDIGYNHLNLPVAIELANGTAEILYVYDATGVKLQKTVDDDGVITITQYAGNGAVYENNTLQFIPHAEGYVTPNGSVYDYVYQYKDHLGNTRLSYRDENQYNSGAVNLEIIEENNYYPFGLKHEGYNSNVSSGGNSVANKFKYNGVELEESLGLDLYEMDVRSYDPAIARFTSIDPVTHFNQSTYNAFDNNPVFWADPSGADSASSLIDAFNKSGSGRTTWYNDGNDGFTDQKPKEGQSVEVSEWHGNIKTTKTKYYHSGGIDGSKSGWYTESNYLEKIAPLAAIFGHVYLSYGSYTILSFDEAAAWLSTIDPTEGFGSFLTNYGGILKNRKIQEAKMRASGVTHSMGFDSPFFIVGGISKFFTGMTSKTEVRIALGVNEYLDDFARLTKTSTWKSWGAGDFQSEFLRVLANPRNKIHFNLDGIDNVFSAVSEGARGIGSSRATSWELFHIYSNKNVLSRTVFYKNGKVVKSPF